VLIRKQARLLSRYLQDQGYEDFLDVTQVNMYYRDENVKGVLYRNVMFDDDGNSLGSIIRTKDGRWQALGLDDKPLKYADTLRMRCSMRFDRHRRGLMTSFSLRARSAITGTTLQERSRRLRGRFFLSLTTRTFAIQVLRNFDDYTPERQSALIDSWLTALRKFWKGPAAGHGYEEWSACFPYWPWHAAYRHTG
jgi:hypothetical protein